MNNEQTHKPHAHERQRYQRLIDIFRIREDVTLLHKAFYIGTVFLGLVLAWYGVWNLIAHIWPLNDPFVAAIGGVVLLLLTGNIKDLT